MSEKHKKYDLEVTIICLRENLSNLRMREDLPVEAWSSIDEMIRMIDGEDL